MFAAMDRASCPSGERCRVIAQTQARRRRRGGGAGVGHNGFRGPSCLVAGHHKNRAGGGPFGNRPGPARWSLKVRTRNETGRRRGKGVAGARVVRAKAPEAAWNCQGQVYSPPRAGPRQRIGEHAGECRFFAIDRPKLPVMMMKLCATNSRRVRGGDAHAAAAIVYSQRL